MKIIIAISLVLILFILLLISPVMGMGTVGIRPRTHGCVGLTIDRNVIHKLLPSADFGFLYFSYYVDKNNMNDWKPNYCLGKDIYYGE